MRDGTEERGANSSRAIVGVACEVFEAAGSQESPAAVSDQADFAALACDFADARDARVSERVGESARVALGGREEEFEVFAAVERERESFVAGEPRVPEQRVDGETRGLDSRADAALAAEVREV